MTATYELWIADDAARVLVVRRDQHHPHRVDVWQVDRPDGARFTDDMRAWHRGEGDFHPDALRFPHLAADDDQADEVLAYAEFVAVWEPIPLVAARYLGCSSWAEDPTPARPPATAPPGSEQENLRAGREADQVRGHTDRRGGRT